VRFGNGLIKLCPYCKGESVRSKTGLYLYDCIVCDRGWDITANGIWHSRFAADKTE
jgi:hypothetical protein